METSVFIARILGPYFVLIALSMLINKKFFQKVMEDYCNNSILILFGGMFAFVFGIVLLQLHNIWVTDWQVVITIMGWSGLIKGVWLILFPNTVCKFMELYVRNSPLLIVHAALAFVLGAILTVCGYYTG